MTSQTRLCPPSLRGSVRRMVRVFMRGQVGGDAGPSYSLAVLGSLWIKCRWPISRSPCCLASPRAQDRRPREPRGRPATGRDPVSSVRLPTEPTAAIDKWAEDHEANRSEAIRQLVKLGLKAKGNDRASSCRRSWTPADDDMLRELPTSGMKPRLIAQKYLHRSRSIMNFPL
jgi:Arc/MetJ-type ribon-helix-helix transcriptional regulator